MTIIHKAKQKARLKSTYDPIDEAAIETFPSSDPPAWTLGEDKQLRKMHPDKQTVAQVLMQEQHLIKKVMQWVNRLIQSLEKNEVISVPQLQSLNEFLHYFIEQCHHQKIAMVYTALQKSGEHPSQYLLRDLKNEQVMGKALFVDMARAIKKYIPQDKLANSELIHLLKELHDLTINHIAKEGEYILPVISQHIDIEQRRLLLVKFKKIDKKMQANYYDKLMALTEKLS